MNENRKMTSIARRINMSFWLRSFFSILIFDLMLLLMIAGTYLYRQKEKIEENAKVVHIGFTGKEYSDFACVMRDENGEIHTFQIENNIGKYLKVPVSLILICEGIYLFFALFETAKIRRKMSPLNELAKKAEELRNIPMDSSKIENLEHAISRVSPDASEIKIVTGDKDLQSIEVALNNLLYQMLESRKQQVRFVSDASHELRTPIAVIQGYVNMLDRWGKEDETVLNESIEALKNESEHMKELVEQLLFLARGDSGRNTLSCAVFDLNELVKEVWEESVMIDDRHTYCFEGTEHAMLYGDFAMIKQSVRIFVQNAVKYSSEKNTITLRVLKSNDSVSYVIQDEGIGIQGNEMAHIFERFYRSDEARNKEAGGSGLGLSIAKWIVDEHKGVIEVLSRPEIGTRFTVRFSGKIPDEKENSAKQEDLDFENY